MNFLHQLLETLNKEEQQLVGEISFTPAETNVFNYFQNHIGKQLPPLEKAAAKLGMSFGNFRKVSSTALAKCYQALVPGGDVLQLLTLLGAKCLNNQMIHELKKEIKRLKKAGELKQLEQLLYGSVERFLSGDVALYDRGYVSSLVDQYKALIGGEENEQVTTLRIQMAYMDILIYRRSASSVDEPFEVKQSEFANRIKALKEALGEPKDPRAQYWLTNFMESYEATFSKNFHQRVEYLTELIRIYDNQPELFGVNYRIMPSCYLALAYYEHSQFDKAFEAYQDVLNKHSDFFYRSLFHVDIFVQLCIVKGAYEMGEGILKRGYFREEPEPYKTTSNWFGPLTVLAIIALLTNRYDEAFKNLHKAREICNKADFFWLDALLRMVENSYFFLVGEYDLAQDMVTRNIKFYQYHGKTEDTILFKQYHLIIRALIKQKFEKAPLSDELKIAYQELQKGDLAFIGKLLQFLRQQV